MIFRPPIPPRWWELTLMFSAGAVGCHFWKKWQESHAKPEPAPQPGSQGAHSSGNTTQESAMPTSGQPVCNDAPFHFGSMQDHRFEPSKIALKSVSISGEVHSLLFRSTVRQEYKNETDNALEVIYTFPLGWDTALLGISATIGQRCLTGQVVEKAKAEEQYEDAVSRGDSAIMVQKSAKGLYTANLGNIKAGETVTVEIRCARLLRFEQGRMRLCVPTVISERYGDQHGPGGLAPHESAKVSTMARYPFSLHISLHGDIAKSTVSCPSHGLQASMIENGIAFGLDADAALDRDFVLLMEGVTAHSLAQCVNNGEEVLVAASFAPCVRQAAVSPLGLKILVDCSGSMGGQRIEQARKGLRQALQALTPQDHVAYSRFGSGVKHMTQGLLPCTPAAMQQLISEVDATDADMGGTEMESALAATFGLTAPSEIPPVVLLITDGDVWAVEQIIQSARKSGHRVFAIGVGSAPSESLLWELAEQTGGACEFVTSRESMADAVVRMFHRIRGSIARNTRINWHGETLWQSNLPRFLHDGETVHCFALLRGEPSSAPVLCWQTDDGEHTATADRVERTDAQDLFRLGMTRRMEEAPSAAEQQSIALKHQLVSERTSLILIYEREDGDKVEGLPKVQHVPQMVTHGHGCYSANVMHCLASSAIVGATISPFFHVMKHRADATTGLDVDADSLLANLVAVWKAHLYQSSSVTECLACALNDSAYAAVREFLNKLHTELGLDMDKLWAAFMQWALERSTTATGLDRHSRRLLAAALSGVSQVDADAVRARCEAWAQA